MGKLRADDVAEADDEDTVAETSNEDAGLSAAGAAL